MRRSNFKQDDISHTNHIFDSNQKQTSPLRHIYQSNQIYSRSIQNTLPRKDSTKLDKLQIDEIKTNFTQESKIQVKKNHFYCDNIDIKSSKAVLQLDQQVQTYRAMYNKSCAIIKDLECKLRSVLSQSQLTKQNLQGQIQMLKADINYIKDQKERNIQNIKIQAQNKHLQTMQKKEEKYRKQKMLFEEEIARQKHQIYQKNQEIVRLRQKNTKNKEAESININFLEQRNRQLAKELEDLETTMKAQMKFREQQLLKQFQDDLNKLHQQQTNQIRVLCNRVNSLKLMLQDKQSQVKQLWKARDLQAHLLFSNSQINNSQINKQDRNQQDQTPDQFVNKKIKQIQSISLLDKYIRC